MRYLPNIRGFSSVPVIDSTRESKKDFSVWGSTSFVSAPNLSSACFWASANCLPTKVETSWLTSSYFSLMLWVRHNKVLPYGLCYRFCYLFNPLFHGITKFVQYVSLFGLHNFSLCFHFRRDISSVLVKITRRHFLVFTFFFQLGLHVD